METLQTKPHINMQSMSSLFSKLQSPKTLFLTSSSICTLRPFCFTTTSLTQKVLSLEKNPSKDDCVRPKAAVAVSTLLKEDWLDSLTSPLHNKNELSNCSNWVIGIDPDLSGALALLKFHSSGCSAQVFDAPYVKVMVGKRIRKRLDARSIVQLIHSLGAPTGTTAYIEQSLPFPKDGKQGWWSGGFGYGLWIGALVASGFSVVPVPSFTWKNEFELSGGNSTKDDSRRIASTLFPSLSSSLNRKKDHGRAEALLIAAYGNGQMMKPTSSCFSEELP